MAVLLACRLRASSPAGAAQLAAPNPLLESRLWLACHAAACPAAQAVARQVWALRGKPVGTGLAPPLLALLGHRAAAVRRAAGDALAAGLAEQQQQQQGSHASSAAVVARLQDLFAVNSDPVRGNGKRGRTHRAVATDEGWWSRCFRFHVWVGVLFVRARAFALCPTFVFANY
jgi:hypothetical protein